MSLLVTGFGPFGEVMDNASGRLAEECRMPFRVVEVAYRAWDELMDELAENPPTHFLLLGVDVNASQMKLETVAHNRIGPKEDRRGEVWGPGPIDPLAPAQLSATLWHAGALAASDHSEAAYDAGGYLCNYSFFRTAQRFPASRVGFIHVPPFEKVSKEIQLAVLRRIIGSCVELPLAA